MRDFVVVGLSHRSAPVEVRERLAVAPDRLERVQDHQWDQLLRKLPGAVIVAAIGYMLNYHVFNTQDTQLAEYEKEMADATAKYGDLNVVKIPILMVEDATKLDLAKETFVSKCAACHLNRCGRYR